MLDAAESDAARLHLHRPAGEGGGRRRHLRGGSSTPRSAARSTRRSSTSCPRGSPPPGPSPSPASSAAISPGPSGSPSRTRLTPTKIERVTIRRSVVSSRGESAVADVRTAAHRRRVGRRRRRRLRGREPGHREIVGLRARGVGRAGRTTRPAPRRRRSRRGRAPKPEAARRAAAKAADAIRAHADELSRS